MDGDTDTMQISDDSGGDGAEGSTDWGASGDDGGYTDDQGDGGSDDGAAEDTGAQDGANSGPVDDAGGGGDWGSFDPSAATDSVVGGLGDTASSAWHAAGHVAHGVGDTLASMGHQLGAGWAAWRGDKAEMDQQFDDAAQAQQAADSELHQAHQDFWGN